MTAIVLTSKAEAAGDGLARTADILREEGACDIVGTAPLHGNLPVEDILRSCVEKGAAQIVVVPYLLHLEEEVRRELSERVETVRTAYPNVQFLIASPIGFDRRLVEIVRDRVAQAALGLDGSPDVPILRIEGRVAAPIDLGYPDFQELPDQIPDVGRIVPERRGIGVWARTLLERTAVQPGATHVLFHAGEDGFFARVSIADVTEKGFLIYQIDGQPLPASLGGPLRLLIPGIDDRCANVKNVTRMELTTE